MILPEYYDPDLAVEELLFVAVNPHDSSTIMSDANNLNQASELWLAGNLDTESYLDQFAEFGDVDYHVERMVKIWDYWGLI